MVLEVVLEVLEVVLEVLEVVLEVLEPPLVSYTRNSLNRPTLIKGV